MTKWHNPSVILAETIAVVKLVYVVGGLYMYAIIFLISDESIFNICTTGWEFVWSIGYEYSIMTGRRKFTWSFLTYVAGRWFTLLVVIIEFVSLETSLNINYQVWGLAYIRHPGWEGRLSLSYS
ncbi:hypothetical protein BC827DRAFT_1164003 [Russula dissimulans]|nr:hypothetical protein BC827DRAFT_1164003 [Russula dissimulans]